MKESKFLNHISELTKIPILVLDDKDRTIFGRYGTFKDDMFLSTVISTYNFNPNKIKETCFFCDKFLNSLLISAIWNQKNRQIYLLGPICIVKDKNNNDDNGLVTKINRSNYINIVGFVYEYLTEMEFDSQQISNNLLNDDINKEINKTLHDSIFQIRENEIKHDKHNIEVEIFNLIKAGDIKNLMKIINYSTSKPIIFLAKTELRSLKNLAITMVAIYARGALYGGAIAEKVYSLSDSYILKIEEEENWYNMKIITNEAAKHFTILVKEEKDETRNSYNILAEKCITLIYRKLNT